ncbi:MAG: hypothetical protein K9I68_04560 [Bacteroidales bacterium]|nr:hypothetical protein [Bacteroidales bacterium]MCF8337525.1 hypothetical protein [Bacteroidales bacterium]
MPASQPHSTHFSTRRLIGIMTLEVMSISKKQEDHFSYLHIENSCSVMAITSESETSQHRSYESYEKSVKTRKPV